VRSAPESGEILAAPAGLASAHNAMLSAIVDALLVFTTFATVIENNDE
jgi:hypothetical protein